MSEEAKREYEISFILLPNLKDEEVNSFGEDTRKTIENMGGVFKNQEKPEKRKLAYPIKKFEFGISLNIYFLLAVERLRELLSVLKQNGQILRHMITSVEEKLSFTPTSVETTESKRKKNQTGSSKIQRINQRNNRGRNGNP